VPTRAEVRFWDWQVSKIGTQTVDSGSHPTLSSGQRGGDRLECVGVMAMRIMKPACPTPGSRART